MKKLADYLIKCSREDQENTKKISKDNKKYTDNVIKFEPKKK